jgi:hypothetical protein
VHVEHGHQRELGRGERQQQRHEEGLQRVAGRAGVLAVGELVQPDLERRQHEQHQADLDVEARARMVVLGDSGLGTVGVHAVSST